MNPALGRAARSTRGDTISPVIMWVGVVLAVIIAATWFITTLRPAQQDIDAAQSDLNALRTAVDRACTSASYAKQYNPRTERGTLLFNQTHACINTSTVIECTTLSCPAGESAFDLEAITIVRVSGNAGTVQVVRG